MANVMPRQPVRVYAATPGDLAEIAAIRTAESGDYPTSVEGLLHEAAVRPPGARYTALLAIRDGDQRPAGTAWLGDEPLAPRADRLRFDIRVRPEQEGLGVGQALYQEIVRRARAAAGVTHIQTESWAAHPRASRFLIERGFSEVWRRLDSSLDLTRFDPAPWAGLEQRLAAQGITLRTYAELAGDPTCLARLHALDTQLWEDVPYGDPVVRPGLAQFEQELAGCADFLPDGCVVALNAQGDYIGYSFLYDGGSFYNTEMTGVLRAYRGRGLALALKLRGIAYARSRGMAEIQTVNDMANAPMLALNRKLGFVQTGANIRYRRALER
jgi:GNAT superfamily N-acetyltransferase